MTGPAHAARAAAVSDRALLDFADEVGATDAVTVVGGRTQWTVGGEADSSAREVRAPVGVVAYEPAEMIVRVRAGTTVEELDGVLEEGCQAIALDPADPARATVGGVLSVGHSGRRRLGWGPVRDTLLEARFVSAEGRLIRAGGPVVKNVTGFDLCRLLVGSLGTIGLLAEVVLRVQPRPPTSIWMRGRTDRPDHLRRLLLRPSSILWDGVFAWVLLEGLPDDVSVGISTLGDFSADFRSVQRPPPLPQGGRWSVSPPAIEDLPARLDPGTFVAEIGVGVVHASVPPPTRTMPAANAELHRRIKANFDPTGRLNPGRAVA